MPNLLFHVENTPGGRGSDRSSTPSDPLTPLFTADEAFRRLGSNWDGSAEIRFANTGLNYPIRSSAVYLGMPVGPDASPLVIRGGNEGVYTNELAASAIAESSGEYVDVRTERPVEIDELVGRVLKRQSLMSSTGSPEGTAISIRGNERLPDGSSRIFLQRTMRTIIAGESFVVQKPPVTLVWPDPYLKIPEPRPALNLISHDGRSLNLTMIGIKIELGLGKGLNLFNVRAQCDTCEVSLRGGPCFVHTNSRMQGGIGDPMLSPGLADLPGGSANLRSTRAQAGLFVNNSDPSKILSAVRGGVLAGHLTFKDVIVRVSQGGTFVPKSLEALNAPIQILAGGAAIAELSKEEGIDYTGWGTATNKARIRNVFSLDSGGVATGDGLRVSNGGVIDSPLGPIHLDISGCNHDGIYLDIGSQAAFGSGARYDASGVLTGGETGLVTTGLRNSRFGMHVRNGSRAFVGLDAASATVPGANPPGPRPLAGARAGADDVALDDVPLSTADGSTGWHAVLTGPQSNSRGSLICVNR